METFAVRIKDLRLEKGLSLEQLEKATKISKSCFSRWENNKTIVNGDQLIILSKFFNVSTDYLLGLED